MVKTDEAVDLKGKVSDRPALPLFIPGWFRKLLPYLKGPALSVYVAYASHANRDDCAYPSVRTLQRVTGLGINAAKYGRALLVGMGLLVPCGQERARGKFGKKVFRVCRTPPDELKHLITTTAALTTVPLQTAIRPDAGRKERQKGFPSEGSSYRKDVENKRMPEVD
jgi:hypothetical protein